MTEFEPILRHLKEKRVPDHRHTKWYLFGGLTLFFLAIQALSGMLLTLYYQPAPDTAHESVSRIVADVSLGWFVRAVHLWSSHLLIFCALVHLSSKYFIRAYRHPRSMTWVSGVFLMLILLAFAFTGHLLPWDTTGYFATQIGASIAAALPVAGRFIADFLRGGSDYVDGMTLTRMYGLHTVVLPFLTLVVAFFHILQSHLREHASPDGIAVKGQIPFYPDFLLRDALAWLAGTMLLFTTALFWPMVPGSKADIFAAPPPGIKPEWYFLPLFQTIRMFPGSIAGVDTDAVVGTGLIVLIAAVVALPWLDRGTGRLPRFVGMAVLVYIIAAITMAYTTI